MNWVSGTVSSELYNYLYLSSVTVQTNPSELGGLKQPHLLFQFLWARLQGFPCWVLIPGASQKLQTDFGWYHSNCSLKWESVFKLFLVVAGRGWLLAGYWNGGPRCLLAIGWSPLSVSFHMCPYNMDLCIIKIWSKEGNMKSMPAKANSHFQK